MPETESFEGGQNIETPIVHTSLLENCDGPENFEIVLPIKSIPSSLRTYLQNSFKDKALLDPTVSKRSGRQQLNDYYSARFKSHYSNPDIKDSECMDVLTDQVIKEEFRGQETMTLPTVEDLVCTVFDHNNSRVAGLSSSGYAPGDWVEVEAIKKTIDNF